MARPRTATGRRSLRAVAVPILVALALWLIGPSVAGAQSSTPPSVIRLEANVQGGRAVAALVGVGGNRWIWSENDARFDFVTVSASGYVLVVYDASRDIYHHIDLATRRTYWMVGKSGPWNPHYEVVGYYSPQRATLE